MYFRLETGSVRNNDDLKIILIDAFKACYFFFFFQSKVRCRFQKHILCQVNFHSTLTVQSYARRLDIVDQSDNIVWRVFSFEMCIHQPLVG